MGQAKTQPPPMVFLWDQVSDTTAQQEPVSFLPCHTYLTLHPLATGKAKEDLQQGLRQKQGPEAPGPEEAALWVSGRLASRVFWVCLTPG